MSSFYIWESFAGSDKMCCMATSHITELSAKSIKTAAVNQPWPRVGVLFWCVMCVCMLRATSSWESEWLEPVKIWSFCVKRKTNLNSWLTFCWWTNCYSYRTVNCVEVWKDLSKVVKPLRSAHKSIFYSLLRQTIKKAHRHFSLSFQNSHKYFLIYQCLPIIYHLRTYGMYKGHPVVSTVQKAGSGWNSQWEKRLYVPPVYVNYWARQVQNVTNNGRTTVCCISYSFRPSSLLNNTEPIEYAVPQVVNVIQALWLWCHCEGETAAMLLENCNSSSKNLFCVTLNPWGKDTT